MSIFINARFLTQPISGVQRYGIECSRQILKKYADVVFVAPSDVIHHDLADEFNATVIGGYKGHNWEQIDLPLYLNELGDPPLLSFCNTAPVAYHNTYVTIHDLAFLHEQQWNTPLFASWYKWLIPRIARKARHIFTVSETMRAEIQQTFDLPLQKISVTYNGVGSYLQSAKSSNTQKEKIILSVGSFNFRKNHHKLIDAFLKSKVNNEYSLIIIGDKNKVFKQTGLDDKMLQGTNVKILEGVTDDQLADWYQRAEIVVSLSAYEGFGIPILEGLYMGCKAICSDIPAYKELYHDTAYFCNADNILAVSKLLEDVTSEPLAMADIDRAIAKYNYGSAADTIITTIEENRSI